MEIRVPACLEGACTIVVPSSALVAVNEDEPNKPYNLVGGIQCLREEVERLASGSYRNALSALKPDVKARSVGRVPSVHRQVC